MTLRQRKCLCLSKNCSLGGILAEANDDLERSVRTLTVELADLKATACRGAVGLRDRSHAGAGFAKSATEACWSELRIDAGLPASLGLVVQALCSSTTSALGAAGVEQNVPHASMSLRRFSRASPRR